MPHLRTIPLSDEALERYHFNRLQIRMEEHIIEGNDVYLYDDDDADYDDEDDDHNENEHDNNKTVGHLSDTILDEVLAGYGTPDELEHDPVSSIKRQRPNHDVHEQRGVRRIGEERNSQDIVSCIDTKKRSKIHYEHDHDDKCQPKELLCDVTKPRPDVTIPAGLLNCDSLDEHKEEDTVLYSTPMGATIDATFKEGFEMNHNCCSTYRYEELKQFKAKYGHCDVSQDGIGEFKVLASWCSKVRTYWRIMNGHQKGRISIELSKNQMQELTELGFNWRALPNRPNGNFSLFDLRYEGLRRYKAKYGHCNVPIADGGEFMILGNWCKKVRKYRKLMKDPLKGPMPRYKLSQKQMQQLTELGFDWNRMGPLKRIKRKTVKRKTVKRKTVKRKTVKRETVKRKTFSDRIKDLTQYKAKYGHCGVSATGEFESLSRWCSKVKTSRKIIEGRLKGFTPHFKLSQKQIQQLTELGFKWEARNRYKVVSGFKWVAKNEH